MEVMDFQFTKDAFGLGFSESRFIHVDDLLPWFNDNYKLHELINDFWGLGSQSRLIAVTKDINDDAWKGLVSEWDSGTRVNGQFRLNKNLIQHFLELSLGAPLRPFKLKELTDLELSIFENFFVEFENYWKDFWKLTAPSGHGTFTYLIWAVELDNREIGSLAIGIPPGIIPKHYKEKSPLDLRSIASNLDLEVPLDLSIGKSTLKISDIKGLEADDLIVLESSSIDYIIWRKNEFEQLCINIEIPEKDNSKFANLYYDEIEMAASSDENNFSDDLLTDLPVELTAQFKSVYMPLNKIIELESGGILPLGLLMDSELTLVAPGDKAIASGNLVIVGNQFGIKINKTNLKGSHPRARLNYAALDNTKNTTAKAATPNYNQQASFAEQEPAYNDQFEQEFSNLDQELEDVGLDPKELDELEDLY